MNEPPGDEAGCLTCNRKPLNFYRIRGTEEEDSKQDICRVICQHFWFQEDELELEIICKICWEKLSEFHEFYSEVEKLRKRQDETTILVKEEEDSQETFDHEQTQPTSQTEQLKVEPLTEEYLEAEEEPEEQIDEESSEEEEEDEEEDDDNQSEYEIIEVPEPSEPRKKRKYTRRAPEEKVKKEAKRSYPYKQKTQEEREAEDAFIRQHTPYVCEDCNEVFEQFHLFQRHCVQMHGKEGFIVCCGIRHRKRTVLYQHVQHVLNPEAFKCEICGRTYKNRFGYNRHKKESHATEEERTFKCHRCPKSFIKEGPLKRHLADHETLDKGTAKCETCGKCFSNIGILKNHVKYRHVKQMEYICDVCSKGFYMRSTFLTHRKTHEVPAEQLRKQCPHCFKWCKNHDYWRVHIRRHNNEGAVSCDICGHVSPNLMALKGHKSRMHTGQRVFPCTFCGKEYARAITMKEHVAAAHTGDILYQCPHCERTFNSSANMHSHRKKMHPKEWLEQRLAKYGNRETVASGRVLQSGVAGVNPNVDVQQSAFE
ncbi:transcription factor grauzone [Aedes aegypti]|uniref:C2H2-type domain-containing protein n=1 Tax=Aedes aegypti TaxID=7159 RepID=A0A1S4FJV6_AEDAE|nr:transcription factor grauzone [Aedes aegypti]